MILADFFEIVDKMLESATMVYTTANSAILIDDPEVSLFMVFFGFVVLEFFLTVLNSLRGAGYENALAQENRNAGRMKRRR